MNRRELMFCDLYAKSRNAVESAELAGFKGARNHAHEILRRPHIQDQINWLSDRAQEKSALDLNVVLNDLGAVALTRPLEFLEVDDKGFYKSRDPKDLNERQMAAVKYINVTDVLGPKDDKGVRSVIGQKFNYTFKDTAPALLALGAHFGLGDGINTGKKKGNPFEDLSQEELDAVGVALTSALPAMIEGEVADG